MGSVCSEIPELPEIVEGVVAKSEAVTEGNMLEVEMDGNKVSCQLLILGRVKNICHAYKSKEGLVRRLTPN